MDPAIVGAVSALLGSALTGIIAYFTNKKNLEKTHEKSMEKLKAEHENAIEKMKLEYEQQEQTRLKTMLSQERNAFYIELIETVQKSIDLTNTFFYNLKPIVNRASDLLELRKYCNKLQSMETKMDLYCDEASRNAFGKIMPIIGMMIGEILSEEHMATMEGSMSLHREDWRLPVLLENCKELYEALRKSIGNTD